MDKMKINSKIKMETTENKINYKNRPMYWKTISKRGHIKLREAMQDVCFRRQTLN